MKSRFCYYLCLILCVSIAWNKSVYAEEPIHHFEPGYRFQLKTLPKHALSDIKYSFWGWNGLGFALGMGAAAGLHPFDDNVSAKLSGHPLFGQKADDVIGTVFSPYIFAGVSFITFLASNKSRNSKLTLAMESSSEACFFSMALVGVGKFAFRRQRPNGGNYSFPSAHSAAAFSTAAVLTEFYGFRAAIPSYAVASVVAVSRLDGNVHYLTDVLAGAVLGTAVGIGTSLAHKNEHADFLLLPQVSSNEIGFVFYKNF